jgi:hypothetical protein
MHSERNIARSGILTCLFQLLQLTRDAYAQGNERIKYTSPALITAALKLARRYKAREHLQDDWSSQSSALYKFCHTLISTLYTRVSTPGVPDLALRLFVSCGSVADQCGFEEVAYEFFAQAFTVYEESISDSRAQFQAICVVAQSLSSARNFSRENYDTLITKCALHGSKLLKKPDQCRAVYLASHLWWSVEKNAEESEDNKEVKEGREVSSWSSQDARQELTNDGTSSFTAMARECWNAYSVRCASQMRVWIQQCRLSCLSRFSIAMCTISIRRMRL